jgi:hypothetical protein
VNRRLLGITLRNETFPLSEIEHKRKQVAQRLGISEEEAASFVFSDATANSAYDPATGSIKILFKDETLLDVSQAADLMNISVLSEPVVKWYLCQPKWLQ